jgi:hypothetical protein
MARQHGNVATHGLSGKAANSHIIANEVQSKEFYSPNPNPFFTTIDPGQPQNLSGATLDKGKYLSKKVFYTIDFMTEKGKTYKMTTNN